MKKTILSVALGASLMSGVAMADVAGDINNSVSMDQVIANALNDGLSIETALQQALAAAPQQADAIIAAAVAANPANAQAVVNAAVAAGVNAGQAVAAAIAGGADSSSVSASTAGGKTTAGSGKLGKTKVILPASTSGGGGGGSGGGGAVVSTN